MPVAYFVFMGVLCLTLALWIAIALSRPGRQGD